MLLPKNRHNQINVNNPTEIDDIVDDVVAAPTVTLVVDMNHLAQDSHRAFTFLLQDGDLAYGLLKFADTLGRLCEVIVIADTPKNDSQTKMWKRLGVTPYYPAAPTDTKVLTTIKTIQSLQKPNASSMYIFAIADTVAYVDLIATAAQHGRVIVGAYTGTTKTNGLKELCHLIAPLREIAAMEDAVDIEEYDFSDFVRIVKTVQDRLPFVGVQFFIERQMSRLGFKSLRTCHKIFHKAKDMGIIEIETRPNKEPNSKDVSACILNREHPIVQNVLSIQD